MVPPTSYPSNQFALIINCCLHYLSNNFSVFSIHHHLSLVVSSYPYAPTSTSHISRSRNKSKCLSCVPAISATSFRPRYTPLSCPSLFWMAHLSPFFSSSFLSLLVLFDSWLGCYYLFFSSSFCVFSDVLNDVCLLVSYHSTLIMMVITSLHISSLSLSSSRALCIGLGTAYSSSSTFFYHPHHLETRSISFIRPIDSRPKVVFAYH